MQRKVDSRMLLVDHQVLGHIVHYAHDLVYLAVTADHLGTKVNRAGHGSLAAVCFVISNLEALPKCVPPFPQDAHEFLADDHVPGAAGFILPPETPPGENRNPGRFEVVAAHNVPWRPVLLMRVRSEEQTSELQSLRHS